MPFNWGMKMKKIWGFLYALLAAGFTISGISYARAEAVWSTVEQTSAEEPVSSKSEQAASDTEQQTDNADSLPDDMKAVFVTPGVDFKEDGSDLAELTKIISSFEMNTVIINTKSEDKSYYALDETEGIIEKTIKAAQESGLKAFVVLDVNDLVKNVDENGLKSGFSSAVHKFASKYISDGILLTDFYTSDCEEAYGEYLRSGSGIGYENWLYETNCFVMRTLGEVIHSAEGTVGMLAEDVWANSSDNPEGSDTQDIKQALYDGHCDIKKYIEDKYADFVMIKAYGTTDDQALNFEKVVSWWDELAQKNDCKTYVCHLNERVGQRSGWNDDQLLRQLAVTEKMKTSGGSAFNSLASLKNDPLHSTETLQKFFNNEINTDTLFEDLTMLSPSLQSFITYDNSVKFMGTFDKNFDVYFDGSKIELNEAGNFFFNKSLDIGQNYFTIEHKGKKYDYSIERRISVLKSVEQTSDITVEGGTRVMLGAVAYSGSVVSASINGEYITLSEKAASETVDANGSYAEFVGYYTAPLGIAGEQQYLGNVSYAANYMGYEEYMTGGSVTVAAEPEQPKTPIKAEVITEQTSAGTGEVVGTIDPVYSENESVTYVKVLNDCTDVLDAKTTGSVPSPEFSQLPAGTLDYYKGYFDGYIITESGRRFREDYVTTFDDVGIGENALVAEEIGDYNDKSYLEFTLDHKISFNVNTSVNYVEGFEGPYGVDYFDPQYVYITFDNVTSVTKLPDFSNCTLFSDGEWDTVEENGIPKFRLTLTLRQAGVYSGIYAYYNDLGNLMLTFNIPTGTLVGKTIVIDPGHGVDGDTFDPGAIGEVTEQSINLEVAKKLAEKLEAMGASVIRLRTEEEDIYDRDRPRAAAQYDADMFLSLHCNSSVSEDAHGCEVYYFTPWSQRLAKSVNDNLSSFLNSVYADGTDSSRGDKYSYYWYTLEQAFPSVLVEMGFVSNSRECLLMANEYNQDGMAEAIAVGIAEYFNR